MIYTGDKVEVIEVGKTYGSYRKWLDKYVKNEKLKGKWALNDLPRNGGIYKVLEKGKHEWGHPMLYYIQDENTKKCYIISESGIRLIKEKTKNDKKENLKIKVGDIVKLKKDTTLEKLTSNKWCGCQIATMKLLTNLSFENFNEPLKVVAVSDNHITVRYNGEEIKIRKDIFEVIKEANILDDEEKRYLGEVVRPFKNRIRSITKMNSITECEQYIKIELCDCTLMLPYFKKETMYSGMEDEKKYTLKELGLDE